MKVLSTLMNWSMAVAVVALTLLTGCENDEISPEVEGIPEETAQDLAHGKLFYVINADSLDNYKVPVAVKGKINVNAVDNNSSYTFEQREIDGAEYIVFKSTKPQTEPIETACLNLSLTSHPELARNVLLVFKKNTAVESKATVGPGGELLSCYSEYLGKGTQCFDIMSNTTFPVLDYNRMVDLGKSFLSVNSNLNSESMIERSGESFQSTMESWAFNVGCSFKRTVPGKSSLQYKDGVSVEKKKSTSVVSGAFTFGMSGSISTSEAYEYYLNLILVKKAEVAFDMTAFEYANYDKPNPLLLALLSDNFKDQLTAESKSFDPSAFFKQWGTDVITQGLFGGCNIYLYGRSENSYQESVAMDASASMTKTKPAEGEKGEDPWLTIFKARNSDYIKGTADVSYKNEQYFKASKYLSFFKAVGGNTSIGSSDPQTWLSGFDNEPNSSSKWSIISYRRGSDSDNPKDSVSLLYPIEQVIHNVIAIYDSQVTNKTAADMAALNVVGNKLNALIDAKDDYLNSHAEEMKTKDRLVIADIIMKNGTNGHKKGEPQPFVDASPRDASKQYIYYPIMANGFCPNKPGYAFETSGIDYTVQNDYTDEYWYYALAPESECDGIVDALFEQKSKIKDVNPYGQFYQSRGNDADEGDGMNTWNYLYVRYFDPTIDEPSDKITAVGFYDQRGGVKNIIASTGGSELKRGYNPGELTAWNKFWSSTDFVKHNSSYIWNEGGSINYHQLSLKLSTQTLPIRRVNESTVCHPWVWK